MKSLRRASYGVLEKVGLVNISVKNIDGTGEKNSRGEPRGNNEEIYSKISTLENENSSLQRKLADKDRHIGTV